MIKGILKILLLIISTTFIINCKKEFSCENCISGNVPPIANAGIDKLISLPTDSVILDGSNSRDPDGNITNWNWSKISGPSSINFTNQNAAVAQVTNLIQGEYFFELKVTDAGGLIDRDTLKVRLVQDTTSTLVDVYIAGFNNNGPVYWKNGQENPLNGNLSGYGAYSIAIEGSNICIAASRQGNGPGTYAAAYWKNGVVASLGNDVIANAVAISGNDVYVAGRGEATLNTSVAKYWKNGQAVSLTNGSTHASANAIAVVGADIYIAGNDGNVAKYWKNGQAVSLTNGLEQAYGTAIAVVGTDIYVAGAIGNVATYWKNGQPVSLTNGQKTLLRISMAVKGNDIYIATTEGEFLGLGSGRREAKYWKNGQVVSLTDGTTSAEAMGIAVHNNDVYVVGCEIEDNAGSILKAICWKNGQAIQLTNGLNYSWANSIQVVNR